jgi:hypothetical protein
MCTLKATSFTHFVLLDLATFFNKNIKIVMLLMQFSLSYFSVLISLFVFSSALWSETPSRLVYGVVAAHAQPQHRILH